MLLSDRSLEPVSEITRPSHDYTVMMVGNELQIQLSLFGKDDSTTLLTRINFRRPYISAKSYYMYYAIIDSFFYSSSRYLRYCRPSSNYYIGQYLHVHFANRDSYFGTLIPFPFLTINHCSWAKHYYSRHSSTIDIK